jgi:hypothetical protein
MFSGREGVSTSGSLGSLVWLQESRGEKLTAAQAQSTGTRTGWLLLTKRRKTAVAWRQRSLLISSSILWLDGGW